jgi:hypothetical protein
LDNFAPNLQMHDGLNLRGRLDRCGSRLNVDSLRGVERCDGEKGANLFVDPLVSRQILVVCT